MGKAFIPGIYNYCDRWCERCNYTSRCRNYESTSKLSPEQLDIHNKVFWDNISDNFKKAMEWLHQSARKHGIDLNKMDPEEEKAYEERERTINTATRQHDLSKLSKQYRNLVTPFFKREARQELLAKSKELVSHLEMGIKTKKEAVDAMTGLEECEDVICWYLFFIDAKLQRALHGKLEGEDWEEDNGYQKDSDGSAKVAIIGIEQSIGAWLRFYELLPEAEDTALTALSILSKLKQKALEEFPHAMAFKRPGFDD